MKLSSIIAARTSNKRIAFLTEPPIDADIFGDFKEIACQALNNIQVDLIEGGVLQFENSIAPNDKTFFEVINSCLDRAESQVTERRKNEHELHEEILKKFEESSGLPVIR